MDTIITEIECCGSPWMTFHEYPITRHGMRALVTMMNENITPVGLMISGAKRIIEPMYFDWLPLVNHPKVREVKLKLFYYTGCFWPLVTLPPNMTLRYEFMDSFYEEDWPVFTPQDLKLIGVYFWQTTPARDRQIHLDRKYLFSCLPPIALKQWFHAVYEVTKKDIFGSLAMPPGLVHYIAEFMGMPMSPTIQKWLYVYISEYENITPCRKKMRI